MTDLTIPNWFIWLISVFGMGAIGWASWVSMTLIKIKTISEYQDKSFAGVIAESVARYDRLSRRVAQHSEDLALIKQHLGMRQKQHSRRDRDNPDPSHEE